MNNYVMALFASGTTNFDYMGLGPLSDAISAIATETATSNGNITYTMEMSYPINGRLAGQLVEGNLIKAQVSKTPGDYMIFEINETLKSDDRTITVYCDAYANRILRMSFDNGGKFGSFGNVQEALNAARAQMTGIQSDFTLSSGIGTRLNMSGVTSKNTMPTTYQDFNAYLDAIMDKVQGNVRFGINSIQIVSDRGRDITDTVLRDDKNTNGISIKVDTSNIVNRIIPILPVLDKDGNATQETKVGKIVTSSVAFKFINFYAGQVVSVDNQDLANSYFNRTNCDRPTTTATVQTSMLDEDLTDIRLFDRVQVYSSKIGYQAKLRVSERDFDILAGAVSEFKLGSSSVTVFNSQTNVVNAINSAVQSSQYAAITADGKNTAYYEGTNPSKPKENDLWFHSVDGISQIDQYVNGNWVTIVSDSTGEQIRQKVSQLGAEAKTAVDQARSASEKTDQLASKYDDTSSLASQAMNKAVSAQGDASSAVAAANSTASEFGKVDQKADSAVASALNAQSAASDAVKQASSAAADSKDAKQIAGAVRQSYKTLTDGSTMTIAELQSGLAVKLTKSDLDGYATQTWTQNQIKVTADGINGTMSSIKSTVDSQTTSINDLKADSSGFKAQFTTVNNTLGKHTTDIGTLQASSKELTIGFNTLTSDNTTNKNDISQLKLTSTELTSTMETVQTQVQNSAVGTNLYTDTQNLDNLESWWGSSHWTKITDSYKGLAVMQTTEPWKGLSQYIQVKKGDVLTYSAYVKYVSGTGTSVIYWGLNNSTEGSYSSATTTNTNTVAITDSWQRISGTTVATSDGYLRPRLERDVQNSNTLQLAGIKVEKGSLATDYSVNPADNATVTAVSSLSQTVDGMKANISKKIEQKDLNGYATETWAQNHINATADGINGTISSVKSTVDSHTTSINDLKADSSSFKSQFTTVNNTLGKQSTDISTLQVSSKSLSANFDSLSSDNQTNQHNISQLQAGATEFNSTLMTVQEQVNDSAVGTNLYQDTRDFDNPAVWNNYGHWTKTGEIYNGMTAVYTVGDWSGLSQAVAVKAGETYTFSIYAKYESGTGQSTIYLLNTNNYNANISYKNVNLSPNWQRVSVTFKITADGYMSPRLERTTANTNKLIVAGPKLERGSIMTDYSTSPLDNATVTAVSSISQTIDSIQTTVRGKADMSKVTQLDNQITSVVKKVDDSWTEIQQNSSNIDLKVSKDGIVNAINMSPETTSIFGKKLFITAETYIADAVITSAMIDTITADKITAGTLNAAKINVINLNATSITTGTLSGANLSLNLNTGVVTFQRGRIHNAGDSIDINIDAGYMSVANGSNRVMLKNGEMQFVEPGTYDTSNNPYLRISNTFGGQSTEGAAFIGRKYATLTNSDNLTGSGIFDIGMGEETFSGIATGYGTGFLNKGWHMTKVGGAERGVVISGGAATSYNPSWAASPSIMVGTKHTSTHSGGMHGPNIIMECDYLYNYSTWRQTSSHAANVYVADDGAIVRASSASKYKTNIERSFETEMGERILEVPTAHWFDKAEVRKKTLNPQAPDPRRYFGMIADDLDDAGLTELVEYNEKGEVEGIMYDRVALALIPIVRNYRDRITKLESEIKQLKEG